MLEIASVLIQMRLRGHYFLSADVFADDELYEVHPNGALGTVRGLKAAANVSGAHVSSLAFG